MPKMKKDNMKMKRKGMIYQFNYHKLCNSRKICKDDAKSAASPDRPKIECFVVYISVLYESNYDRHLPKPFSDPWSM